MVPNKAGASSSAAASAAAPDVDDESESRTTILPSGAVESRNYDAPRKSQISSEIRAFLSGADGNGAAAPSPRSEFRTYFTIWMFLTRLPSPSWIDLHPGHLMRGMCYFPVAGTVLGGMYAIVFDCSDVSFGLPPAVAASAAVGFGLYVTGCFHEDGLADSADGLGGGWSRRQVLKIMTDSRVGTFGCAALSLFLFAKLQLLGSLGTSRWNVDLKDFRGTSSGAGPAILAAQTLSRLSAPYLIRTRDYVAEVGPKSPFYLFMVEAKHIVSWPRVLFASAYCFAVCAALYGPAFATLLLFAVLSLAHLAGSKGSDLLGGVMGDFLGGTICICEILVLTLIAARDSIDEIYRVALDAIMILWASDDDGSEGGTSNLLRISTELYGNDHLRPLFHLLWLLAALKMWRSCVGPPDMYDREDGTAGGDDRDKKD